MPSREPAKARIHGQKFGVKRAREGKVGGIIGREIIAKTPYLLQKMAVVMPDNSRLEKCFEGLLNIGMTHLPQHFPVSQGVNDFKIDQMRCLAFGLRKTRSHLDSGRRLFQDFQNGGRVDDDHLPSRIARITSADDSRVLIRRSLLTFASHSSIVG